MKPRKVGRLLDIRKVRARLLGRDAVEIVVGKTYFLSGYQDISGAYVEVVEKSEYVSPLGAPSVKVKMLVKIGNIPGSFYEPGTVTKVNANNLYKRREDASRKRRNA